MKTLKKRVSYALAMFLCLLYTTSCSQDAPLSFDNTEISVASCPDEINDLASLHSITLDCVKEVMKDQELTKGDLTNTQLYAVTESAVLKGVQKYIAQKEGRTLTSTEENTLKQEVSSCWNDSRNRTLMKKLSQSDAIDKINPITGSTDLNTLYKNLNISTEAQRYFNKMFGNMNSANYESILDQLYMEVWSQSAFSDKEKQGVMNVIAVTKDSYKYWTTNYSPMTRLSGTAKGIIASDAYGALRGLWAGLGRSVGSLIFGPGGAVLTIGGSVIANAAVYSVEAGIIAGAISFW